MGALFRFLRFDVQLERDWLSENFGVDLSPRELAQARRFDDPDVTMRLYEISAKAAAMQMDAGMLDEYSAFQRLRCRARIRNPAAAVRSSNQGTIAARRGSS